MRDQYKVLAEKYTREVSVPALTEAPSSHQIPCKSRLRLYKAVLHFFKSRGYKNAVDLDDGELRNEFKRLCGVEYSKEYNNEDLYDAPVWRDYRRLLKSNPVFLNDPEPITGHTVSGYIIQPSGYTDPTSPLSLIWKWWYNKELNFQDLIDTERTTSKGSKEAGLNLDI